jgi:hypothetical protein
MNEELEKKLAETNAALIKMETIVTLLNERVNELCNKSVVKESDSLSEINELKQNPYAILCNMAVNIH